MRQKLETQVHNHQQTILSLPVEVLHQIFNNMERLQIWQSRLVCKHFYSSVFNFQNPISSQTPFSNKTFSALYFLTVDAFIWRIIYVDTNDPKNLVLFNVETNNPIKILNHSGDVVSVRSDPKSNVILTKDSLNNCYAWNADNGDLIKNEKELKNVKSTYHPLEFIYQFCCSSSLKETTNIVAQKSFTNKTSNVLFNFYIATTNFWLHSHTYFFKKTDLRTQYETTTQISLPSTFSSVPGIHVFISPAQIASMTFAPYNFLVTSDENYLIFEHVQSTNHKETYVTLYNLKENKLVSSVPIQKDDISPQSAYLFFLFNKRIARISVPYDGNLYCANPEQKLLENATLRIIEFPEANIPKINSLIDLEKKEKPKTAIVSEQPKIDTPKYWIWNFAQSALEWGYNKLFATPKNQTESGLKNTETNDALRYRNS